MEKKRILVACEKLTFAGGLFRFERVGRAMRSLGHELAWLQLGDEPPTRASEFPVLNLDQAASMTWTATMVPGAGFRDEVIRRFAFLTQPQFGIRVQHVLNDQSRKPQFLSVNRSMQPDLVVFNNPYWPSETHAEFRAERFAVLQGGIDVEAFASVRPQLPRPGGKFVIGGLANKNPAPLLDALRLLPDDVELRLFGRAYDLETRAREFLARGALKLVGFLNESDLPVYYAGLHCVVHTAAAAGWANLAAEAMAAGVPVICSPHGTLEFAKHGQTAIVLDRVDGPWIAGAIRQIRSDQALARTLAQNARAQIAPWNWESYTSGLLDLIDQTGAATDRVAEG